MAHAHAGVTLVALSERFDRALVYATYVHAGQRRKGADVPYIAHLLSVAALVLEHGGDEDLAIAGLLHDAAEDHGGEVRLVDVEARFGSRVASITRACSDSLPEAGQAKAEWRSRKLAYLDALERHDSDALLVTSADKLHNARGVLHDYRELGEDVWDRFKGGREGTLWYYRQVADVLLRRLPGSLTRQLERTVCRIEEVAAGDGAERGSDV